MKLLKINNITNESNQRHIIERENGNVTLVIRYHEQIQQWTIDVSCNGKNVYGVKLATGVKHIPSQNMGVDFVVIAGEDLDPFQVDDFSEGRCNLLMVDYDAV